MDTELTTPVLLLVFNRPEKTKIIFDTIRSVRPTKLYVAADAPREGRFNERALCEQVRSVVKNVDWKCEAHYLFHDKNLGCALSGVTAWNWIFEHEDRMIFLEDDGLPTKSFFFYCQDLLERYKDDDRIGYIGGVNFGQHYGDASYYYSRIPASTYGMATWKRTQQKYEFGLESYYVVAKTKEFKSNFNGWFERIWYRKKIERYLLEKRRGKISNSYDIQMLFMSFKYGLYNIYPQVNMVSNIGFDTEATNYDPNYDGGMAKDFANRPTYEIETINYNDTVYIDKQFEDRMFRQRGLFNRSYCWALKDLFVYSYLRQIPFMYMIGKWLRKFVH